ncbi:MAG: methionyl-tRNA formyltransferase [Alphaproteobacteria bacterium]|nr:MAG: methionyl-tRNA formyltransferase [Alphaproteobacteria bacterium]
MRFIFMGTPDLARTILSDLHQWSAGQDHEIVGVYSQPPRRAGRGKKTVPSPVHAFAVEHNLPVFTPTNFKSIEDQAAFAGLNADIAIVAAYGLILPKVILDAPKYGCLNVHGSLLPRWRGAAPIQRAIMAGDTETGVNIMRMEKGLDTGPVYRSRIIPILTETTAGRLHDQLAAGNMDILAGSIDDVMAGVVPTPQSEDGVTYASKIDKAEARIDWSRTAPEVDQLIRGISPFPGAWFEYEGERIKVLRSQQIDGAGPAGTVLDDVLTIACGTSAVQLLELQRAGKKPVAAADLLRGFTIPKGTIL